MIFEGVDDIPWGEFTYAYSGRCDVPALLRSLLAHPEQRLRVAAVRVAGEVFVHTRASCSPRCAVAWTP